MTSSNRTLDIRQTEDKEFAAIRLMNDAIYEIYGAKNKSLYLERQTRTDIRLSDDIDIFCRRNGIIVEEFRSPFPAEPFLSWEWSFTLPPFTIANERSEYNTFLMLSKLCPVSHRFNRYTIIDRNPDTLYGRMLESEGYSGLPVTGLQKRLCDLIDEWVIKLNYLAIDSPIAYAIVVGLIDKEMMDLYAETNQQYTQEFYYTTYYKALFSGCYDDFFCLDYYYEKHSYENNNITE